MHPLVTSNADNPVIRAALRLSRRYASTTVNEQIKRTIVIVTTFNVVVRKEEEEEKGSAAAQCDAMRSSRGARSREKLHRAAVRDFSLRSPASGEGCCTIKRIVRLNLNCIKSVVRRFDALCRS